MMKQVTNIGQNGIRLTEGLWSNGVMEYWKKRISNTPVLQYSNDIKQCQIEWIRTKGNLSYEVTEEDLKEAFEVFGKVETIKVVMFMGKACFKFPRCEAY